VLAGIGAARVLSSRGFVARTVIVAVSVLVAFADTFGGGIPLAAIGRHGRLAERIVYEWIARQPPGAVLELPIGPLDYDYRAFRYQYATLVHGHPLVNGWTGYSTPLQQWLGSTVSPLRDPDDADDAIRFLQGLGVGYVVFHPDDFADGDAAAHLQRMLTTRTDVFRRGEQWGSIVAYALAAPAVDDPPPAATTPIPIASITASQRTEAAGALLDGRIDTLWTTAKPQSGDEWLRVTLAARATPTEAALRVNPAVFNDYPRRLVVDAESSGSSTTVFSGAVAGAFGAAFRRAPEDLWIRIPLRPAVADALRLRQTGHAPWWWSVAGLQVRR
jgi:hypothetical protein